MWEDKAVALKLMVIQYRGVFAEHDMDFDFSTVKHVIDTNDARHVKQRPRQTPLLRGRRKTHYTNFGCGYYFQGCFRVVQLFGSLALSDIVMPKISECIVALAGCEYFSGLDMANVIYQIKMEEEERYKKAFVTKYGQFVFNRIPFGLSNARGTFCRALGLVLRGLSWESVVSFLYSNYGEGF